jgi:MHS family proline/betaine transporter-like MFS transporter
MYYIIGNALEFYDFTIFAFFTPLIGALFFPSSDPFYSLIFGLTIFSVAFIARPLGAVFFGHLGDRFGRKHSLIISLSLMAIATLSIGLLPTAKEIGTIAPILLFISRFTQGFSAGGEYGGVSVILMEISPLKHRSFWGAFVPMSCGIGALLAVLTGAVLQHPYFPIWSWRIAFILGGAIGSLALFARLKASESPQFENLMRLKARERSKSTFPLNTLLKQYFKPFILTFMVGSFNNALINFSFVYMNIYLNQSIGLTMSTALFYNSFSLISFIISTISFGYLSDFIRKEFIMKFVTILFVLFSYPLFILLQFDGPFYIILAEILFGLMVGAYAACTNGYLFNLFPVEIRASGMGIGYSLGMALVGSTVPLVCSLLIMKFDNLMMPALYLITLGLLMLILENRTKFLKCLEWSKS